MMTLGIQENTTIDKREIARLQLIEAITLFLAGDFIPSITLAGAAEAVLVGLLEQAGQESISEESAKSILRLRDIYGLSVNPKIKEKDFYRNWNSSRNALKHHNKNEPNLITINLLDEAYWMIRRALSNSNKANLIIDNANHLNFGQL